MDRRKRTSVCGFCAVALISALLVLLSASSPTASADPGDLFVTVAGSGTACTQASPCSLQTALANAEAGDNIYLAAGTYTGAGTEVVSVTESINLYGGWNGAASGPVARDPDSYASTLDGESTRRVVRTATGLDVTIEGLTITNGAGIAEGAGVWSYGSDLTVSDTVIYSNVAYVSGADAYGGGLYIEDGTLTVVSVTFRHNSAMWGTGSDGGGLYVEGDVDVTIENSLFDANDAWYGSGLRFNGDSSEPLTIKNTTFKDNGRGYSPMASGGYGGGIWVADADALVEDCSFLHNRASNHGGAISFSDDRLVMNSSYLYDNYAGNTAGVLFWSTSQFKLTNNIIADNGPRLNWEGGVEVRSGAEGLMLHNTMASNTGAEGGYGVLVRDGGTVAMVNTILVSHAVGISMETGASAVLTNTLWGTGDWANDADWGGSGSPPTHSGDLWGDPSFVDPDGGDYHIRGDSAAFDQGVDSLVTDDVDGEARPWTGSQAKAPDIGADEFWLIPTEDVNLPLVLRKH